MIWRSTGPKGTDLPRSRARHGLIQQEEHRHPQTRRNRPSARRVLAGDSDPRIAIASRPAPATRAVAPAGADPSQDSKQYAS